MKQLMNDKFVPLTYEQKMYYKLSWFGCTKEFCKLYARCRL